MEYNISMCNQNDKVKSYFLKFSNGFMFLFWVPQSGKSSRIIDIYFSNERCVLKEDRVGLSLNGIVDINNLVSGINVFKEIMKVDSNGMSFCFIPFNEKEADIASKLGSRIGKFVIDDSNYKREVINNNVGLNDNSDRIVYLEGNEIRDSKDNLVGYVNRDGFSVNWENNSIERNSEFVGFIGDKSFKVQDGASQGKSNTRVKMPGYAMQASRMGGAISHEPSGEIGRRRDAAFVSLPVIMFVLSFMMLIGSIILLFILD